MSAYDPKRTLPAPKTGNPLRALCTVRLFSERGLLALEPEGKFDFSAIGINLSVLDHHVQISDFGDPQITKGLASTIDGGGGGLLPRILARSRYFDEFIDAFRHSLFLPGLSGPKTNHIRK